MKTSKSLRTFLLTACLAACASLSARPEIGFYEAPGSKGAARIPAVTNWFGRAPDRALDFFAYDSWPSLESDAAWTAQSWSSPSVGPPVAGMTFSMPLTVWGTPLADVAAGYHDNSFIAVAKSLVSNNWSSSIIRLGWEFNGTWMPWAAGQNTTAYVAAYRHVVALMRSVPGSDFTFDWCVNCGTTNTPSESVYPGDDVVDIIGMDLYDRYYVSTEAVPAHRWNTYLTQQYGLNWLAAFARQHGKPISMPEWGTGESYLGDGGIGGGDDPLFVNNMIQFLSSNSAVYSNYWDNSSSGYNGMVSDGEHPLSGAALKAAYSTLLAAPGPMLWIAAGDAATNNSVSINYGQPATGGAPAYYALLYRVSGQGSWIQYGTATYAGWQAINGLEAGTAYDFEVYAANQAGNGAASSVLTLSTTGAVATGAAPGPIPWIGLGQGVASTSISINFAPPNYGGTPSSYIIQYRVSGQTAWQKTTVTWTGWQTVAGLNPGTSYDFQVYASNAAGTGGVSAIFTVATGS